MTQKQSFDKLQEFIEGKIIGQKKLVNRLLVALLADGHMLVEGAPGLAKTRAIQVLSEAVEGDFHRFNLPLIYSLPILRVQRYFNRRMAHSNFKKVLYFITLFLRMKLTVRLRKCSRLY